MIKILVAEDNPMNQKVIRVMLEKSGYTCQIVEDGKAAVAEVQRQQYRLILMDCQMPEMDGFMATLEIRKIEQGNKARRIPILALTANSMKGDREKCLSAGMDDFIAKPFKFHELVEKIQLWTGGGVQ